MRYFKDKKGELTSIDDRIWPIVLRNEPWIKETDKNLVKVNKMLDELETDKLIFENAIIKIFQYNNYE